MPQRDVKFLSYLHEATVDYEKQEMEKSKKGKHK